MDYNKITKIRDNIDCKKKLIIIPSKIGKYNVH